jgi:hypothetical protein
MMAYLRVASMVAPMQAWAECPWVLWSRAMSNGFMM